MFTERHHSSFDGQLVCSNLQIYKLKHSTDAIFISSDVFPILETYQLGVIIIYNSYLKILQLFLSVLILTLIYRRYETLTT